MRRRTFLAASSAGLGSLFAGCAVDPFGSPTETPSPTPAVRDWAVPLEAQPFLVRFALGSEYVYYTVGSNLYATAREDGFRVGRIDISDFGVSELDALADGLLAWTTEGVGRYDTVPGSEPRWRRGSIQDGAVVSPDRLVGTDDGAFTAVDLADGRVRWDRTAPGVAPGLLGWTDDTLVTSGVDGETVTLWGLARADGATRWRTPLPADTTTYVPTTVADGVVHRGSNGFGPGRMLALAAADGTRRWERSLGEGFVSPLGTLGDALLVRQGRSDSDRLVALGAADGTPRWSTPTAGAFATGDDWLLALDGEGRFAAVGAEGSARWTVGVDAPGEPEDRPERSGAVGDTVVLNAGRRFVGVAPGDGSERWRYDHVRTVREWWYLGAALLLWDGQVLRSVPVP